jgi:hypothetical protein
LPNQSLADVARTSSASRKDQPKGAKVYTNDNLRTDITPSAPVAPAATPDTAPAADGAMATTADAGTTPAEAAPGGPVTDARDQRSKDEAAWRQRMTSARAAVDRSTSLAAALQSQNNAHTVEFNKSDHTAQRRIEQRRVRCRRTRAHAARIEANKKAITAIEDKPQGRRSHRLAA